ncbi:MAG: hypothetical protein ABSC23_09445 [Bryobacteraceae bacterium]
MAFFAEKRAGAFLTGLLLLAPAGFAQREFRYDVWHGHAGVLRSRSAGEFGKLTLTETGVSFEAKPHSWRWAYQDIRQLKVSPNSIVVLTYRGNKWKLGADREYRFDLDSGKTFADAYAFLAGRLDQRFVAALPELVSIPLWEIPAKHSLRFGGDEGVLQIGPEEIVYRSGKKDESRTWRYGDIENISSSGPFQLTITTFERAKSHYGDLKGFNFELKQPLGEDRYNDLWLRLNRSKGLKILDSYQAN